MSRQLGNATGIQTAATAAAMRTDGGFVLVSVLWLLALLAVVTFVLLTTIRLDVRATGQLVRHAEAEALADGLMRLVALRLGDRTRRPLAAAGIPTDGTAVACVHDDAIVDIAVSDVGGLVDLNAAPVNVLEWLLLGLGLAPDNAAALAAAIVDFRDADDVPGVHGAESAAYRAAGLAHGPKNGPFETVTELDQVLGMNPGLLERLRPVVTVYSRQPGVDPTVAPRAVLAAGAAVAAVARPASPARIGEPRLEDIPSEFRIRSSGRAYRVTVSVQSPRGGRFAREAVVEPARTAPLGFWMREWTVATPAIAPASGASASAETCVRTLL